MRYSTLLGVHWRKQGRDFKWSPPVQPPQDVFALGHICLGLLLPVSFPPLSLVNYRVALSSSICSRVLLWYSSLSSKNKSWEPPHRKDSCWSTTQSPRGSVVAPSLDFHRHSYCISLSHPFLAVSRLGEMLEASRLHPWKCASSFAVVCVSQSLRFLLLPFLHTNCTFILDSSQESMLWFNSFQPHFHTSLTYLYLTVWTLKSLD